MKVMRPWRIIFVLVVVLILFVGLVNSFKNVIAKASIAWGVTQVTGTKTLIGSCRFNVLKGQVEIHNLRIYNPAGFPPAVLLDMPEIAVDYNLPAFLQKKLHLPLVLINLKEVMVMRNKDGQLNVDGLKFLHNKGEKMEFAEMQFDMVTLNAGRVVYKDLNTPDKPPQIFYLNIQDKSFHNISGAQPLATAILFETMKSTAIKNAAVYTAASQLGYGSVATNVLQGLLSSDEVRWSFAAGFDKVYTMALKVAESMGTVKQNNKPAGLIKSNIQGVDVVIKTAKVTNSRVQVTVSARKLLMPRQDIASQVLYAIEEKMK